MLTTIHAAAFNGSRFFKIYGANGADIVAWSHPRVQDHKQLVVANQNLPQENFRSALESLMGEFSQTAMLFCDEPQGTGIAAQ
ncbi:MAG: hypothetical protein IT560_07160 [Alphaproteobacteria bacterium]|jgi:hypothetical protein|nr:hypothetical protein [Alphaproteobacteria bacterium]